MNSGNYQDYVFKDGQSSGILKGCMRNQRSYHGTKIKLQKKSSASWMLRFCDPYIRETLIEGADLGCGLGYLTQRFNTEALVSPMRNLWFRFLTYGSSLLSEEISRYSIRYARLNFNSARRAPLQVRPRHNR